MSADLRKHVLQVSYRYKAHSMPGLQGVEQYVAPLLWHSVAQARPATWRGHTNLTGPEHITDWLAVPHSKLIIKKVD